MQIEKLELLKPLVMSTLTASMLLLVACGSPGPKYRNVGAYSEGLAPVQVGAGQWGFINERQEWVIQPQFEDAKAFQAGRAAAKKNGKWGFINTRGQWL